MLILKGRKSLLWLGLFAALITGFSSCLPPIIIKAPSGGAPFIISNSIEVKGGKFTKSEKTDLKQRLFNQLNDSSVVTAKDILFLLHVIKRPPVYDSAYSESSKVNLKASLFHLGYYSTKVDYSTHKTGRRLQVKYTIDAGQPTLIDSVTYRMSTPDLQRIAQASKSQTKLGSNKPISKADVMGEITRLVDTFRNNGYYKITSAELSVKGDTTIAPLTSISDDPFEALQLLAEAEKQKDSPHIDLSVVMTPPPDSSRLFQYHINNIYVLPDYRNQDNIKDENWKKETYKNLNILSHQQPFRPSFLARNITMKPGSIFRQQEYYKTLNNLNRAGVWQSVNLKISEPPDSINKVDIIMELTQARKYGFETALEASYLSSTNATSALAGNLFGLSMNVSLADRNVSKEAIRMTHSLRGGIELNNNRGLNAKLINSNEIGYSNNILFPKLVFPKLVKWLSSPGESFINTNISYNTRLNLFNMQTYILNFGWNAPLKRSPNWKIVFRPFNMEFNNLFNQTDSFTRIITTNPFLRYSYNTSYVTGMSFSISNFYSFPKNISSNSRERFFRFNTEESGLTWGNLPTLKKYLRRFIKFDAEWKYTVTYPKTILAFRSFIGVGIPLLGTDSNKTLPFFKQFFGGGVNSMRGWPARGIGMGGQARTPYTSSQTIFNDRTGDLQLEANVEYRYTIARIIPNTLTLRGALFVDMGNVWNLRNLQPTGKDSAQFKFSNLYSQLGVSAGTGFRIDFNYVVLRLDLGFRFKRPDLFYINNGWKAPEIGFDDFFKKMFARGANDEYRKWRYENFNFSIGISYPF